MAQRAFLLALFFLSSSHPFNAQQTSEQTVVSERATAPVPIKPKPSTKRKTAAEKAKIEQQRSLALSLMVSLANDARSFRDDRLRARTLARIADGIWEVDQDQALSLFQRAWDAAETADQESARLAKEDRERQEREGRGSVVARGPDLRSEVLRMAARRDRALGEELLEKLKLAKTQEASDLGMGRRDPHSLPEAIAQRLRLARQLLEVDIPKALQFADPALETVSMQGLSFLSYLKEKDAAAADQRYVRMLGIATADVQSDANTVSLLSSYVFTPQIFITIDRNGGTNTSQTGRSDSPPVSTPATRAAFFNTATQILMRPLATPEQDQTTSGIEGKYLIIKRLLPLFEQHAAKETTDLIRGQLAALTSNVSEETRRRDDDMMRRGIRPEQKPADREQSLLDRISRAKTSADRDDLWVELIAFIADKGDLRARDFVDKIDDSEIRKQVRPYVDVTLVIHFVDKKKPDEALRLARIGELTHFQRVWALSQVARQIHESDREQALTLLDEAMEEARRIEGSDADRPRALVGIANARFLLDRTRAWETVTEAVKAANSTTGFSGEDSRLTIQLRTRSIGSMRTNSAENFDVPSMFIALSRDNYDRAVGLARNFEADAPRATALISIAREVLTEK